MSTDNTVARPPEQPDPPKPSFWPGLWQTVRGVLTSPPVLAAARYVLVSVITAVAVYFGLPREKVEVLVPILLPLGGQPAPEPPPAQGWVNDPQAVEESAKLMPTLRFSQTPAGQVQELPKFVYLWQLQEKVTGKPVPQKDQNPTGSCVGFGTTTAIERTLAADIAARGGDPSEFTLFSEEVTYAGSRVEVNGGRSPIRGDGSNGSWAARWATQWGMVPKGKYGNLDLTEYSAARARAWNNTGVPDELEPVAKKFPVKDAVRITNWADAKRALANGYGIQVASNQGFAGQRDANGVCRAQGNWAHSMCLDGYHTEGGREYGHIENSWAKTGYHRGPVGWGNPSPSGFWADAAVVDSMLRQGDSWAYSGAVGFPRKALPDWFISAPNPMGEFEDASLSTLDRDRLYRRADTGIWLTPEQAAREISRGSCWAFHSMKPAKSPYPLSAHVGNEFALAP